MEKSVTPISKDKKIGTWETYAERKVTSDEEAFEIIRQYAKAAHRFHESASHDFNDGRGDLVRVGFYVDGTCGVADGFWAAMKYLALKDKS